MASFATFCALGAGLLCVAESPLALAQADPASEPTVLAVAKVLPAVVNINTERVVRRRVRDPFEDFAAQYFGNYRSRPREISQTLQSLGSGFIIDPAGYIVKNQHVVERAADLKIEVTMSDGKTVPARFVTGDEKKDLALIKIEAKEPLPFISLDQPSPNLLGQTVIVVGNALGYSSSISRGVLSGMKRDITIDEIEYKNLLQTDAAIPAETVRDTVAEFKKIAANQPVPKGTPGDDRTASAAANRLFGLQLQDLTQDLTDALGLAAGKGVLVSAVEAGSPAESVGIERGLVIYRVGKYDVRSVAQVEKLLARARSGTSVDFTVGIIRAGNQSPRVETVTLTAR